MRKHKVCEASTSAAIIGISQIVVLVFAGLLTTFGRSPYAFMPIAIIKTRE